MRPPCGGKRRSELRARCRCGWTVVTERRLRGGRPVQGWAPRGFPTHRGGSGLLHGKEHSKAIHSQPSPGPREHQDVALQNRGRGSHRSQNMWQNWSEWTGASFKGNFVHCLGNLPCNCSWIPVTVFKPWEAHRAHHLCLLLFSNLSHFKTSGTREKCNAVLVWETILKPGWWRSNFLKPCPLYATALGPTFCLLPHPRSEVVSQTTAAAPPATCRRLRPQRSRPCSPSAPAVSWPGPHNLSEIQGHLW